MYKLHKIGLFGYGRIGKGVDKVLSKLSLYQPISLVKIFDIEEKREEIGQRFCTSIDEIIDDEEIDIVIEAMGGDVFPYECIKQALKAHKHVITSNKQLVANHLKDLLTLAHENGVSFQFEACCGGGSLMIRPLIELAKYDQISSLKAILSSSINLMLSLIQDEGKTFRQAIQMAGEQGVLEKDYIRDIAGSDMADKIAILSSLAYSTPIDVKKVYKHGIDGLTDEIIKDINLKGYYLKFLARSNKVNNEIYIGVAPTLVKQSDMLVAIKGIYNCVFVNSKYALDQVFGGVGAGSLSAASGIAHDVMHILENKSYIQNVDVNNYVIKPYDSPNSNYYVYKNGSSIIVPKSEMDKIKDIEFFAIID